MSESSTPIQCPTCGATLPARTPEGLCPKCLLSGAAAPTEAGLGHERPAAPSLEAVVAAFPQLEIIELVGQGGMGCVFKARQPQLNRFVALKILPEALGRDAAFASRFTREAQALASLSHPNIVTIHDFGQANGFFYLVMEFVDGVNLRQALRGGRFTPEQALSVVPPICDALQFAHERGIVHRDIKPENLLLDKSGHVKIADFGIAKMLAPVPSPAQEAPDAAAFEHTAAGTPQYMAPEQRDDPRRADHRADIYSLGVVLYEMLTGELPGARLQPPSQKVQIDVRLDEVVLRALEREPARRYPTALQFKTSLETAAGAAGAAAEPPRRFDVAPQTANPAPALHRQRSAPAFSHLALALLLGGTLGTLLLLALSPRHEIVLVFGAMALVVAAAFGALSWKERLGKGVALASFAIMVAAGATILVLAELIPVPGRQAQAERARRLAELEQAKIAAQSASTASPDVEPSPSRPRQFVRLVAGLDELTFQGEPTTWERLPELLEGVTNRAQTVFEFATATDDFTVTQVDELRERAGRLSRQFSFEYLSHVGSHPLGTLGTATSPREVVDQWLSHVKANRMKAMWDLTTRESGGAGSVDLRQTWEFDTIKAFTLARSDSLAMVVTTRYKDNAGRERMVLFSLTNRDGRWLIRDNAVASPDHAESRLDGFTEHPGVFYDVRREDVIGRWTQAFFSPATFRFEADGGFSMSYRVVGGARTNLHGTWQIEADRLTYRTGAGGRTGHVVRVREDFFQLKHADGNLSGFQRMNEDPQR